MDLCGGKRDGQTQDDWTQTKTRSGRSERPTGYTVTSRRVSVNDEIRAKCCDLRGDDFSPLSRRHKSAVPQF